MSKLTEQYSYLQLKSHHQCVSQQRIADWFTQDPHRFKHFSLEVGDFLLDYSKNHITQETMGLLLQLAEENQLSHHIASLFTGKFNNLTEERCVLHTALRDKTRTPLMLDNADIQKNVQEELNKFGKFCDYIHQKKSVGTSRKAITDVINIGIGGSHLGPMMAVHALKPYRKMDLNFHFISNVDEAHIKEVLAQLDPKATLCIVSSKTFTTLETLQNAERVRKWFKKDFGKKDFSAHWIAVTAAPEKAIKFGIRETQIFSFWDWVGGRYSIWSAIGLPLMLLIGKKRFQSFLEGAFSMDCHFREAPIEKNFPIILGLLGIWYINFFHAHQLAVIPYTYRLQFLPDYLQQLDMESNGKVAHLEKGKVSYATGPIIFGNQGSQSQHSFFQLMHQGNHYVPVDFIATGELTQDVLTASAIAQAQAFMLGKSYDQAYQEAISQKLPAEKASWLAQHKMLPGNRPSNFLFIRELSPFNLGALIALYEHKIFVQGVIWGVNSFDQWGVELGKQLLPHIIQEISHPAKKSSLDASTQGLINYYRTIKGR